MLRVDAQRLARNKRGMYLDLLARLDQRAGVEPSLVERMTVALADARVRFPQLYLDLDGPFPWAEAVMIRIAFRGPRRAVLAQLVAYVAEHSAWDGVSGELVRTPSQSAGIDKHGIVGLTAGMRLRGRRIVRRATYPPADTPPELLEVLLQWADVDDADKVYISTWNRDRRVSAANVRHELPSVLSATSNIGLVTSRQGVWRRVSLARDCVMATACCRDAADRSRELDRFAELFRACPRWVTFGGVAETGMVMLDWIQFLWSGAADPPHARIWEDVVATPDFVVPDAYALQLHTSDQPRVRLGSEWDVEELMGGHRIIRAKDPESWLSTKWPDPRVSDAARAEFDRIIARPTDPFGYTGVPARML